MNPQFSQAMTLTVQAIEEHNKTLRAEARFSGRRERQPREEDSYIHMSRAHEGQRLAEGFRMLEE